jgi:FSR family fosmidomycin resistance protein-like MFS transporter
MTTTTAGTSAPSTIGLIGLAHGTSHFFHMLLPPLFPVFIQDFGLSYSELGLLVTCSSSSRASGRRWRASWWTAWARARCCCSRWAALWRPALAAALAQGYTA